MLVVPDLLQDVKFALRQMRKTPGFAVTAVLTLALGIGANTAMFTVIDSVLVRPLPYRDATRLVVLGEKTNVLGLHGTSWLNLQDIRNSKTFDEIGGYFVDVAIVQTAQGGQTVLSPKVTGNMLSILGVNPILGRVFNDGDCAPGAPLTVLLSNTLWRGSFAADPSIVGRTIRIGDVPHTVIGVMPPGFGFPDEQHADAAKGVWLPVQPTGPMLKERGFSTFTLLGVLHPGVTDARASAELAAIAARIRRLDPNSSGNLRLGLQPYRDFVAGSVRSVFLALSAALGLVLLIACTNVANLQLARYLARYQEFAVRSALGAPKARLIRELVVESGTVSAFGAVAGFALAVAILRAIRALPEDMIPRAAEIHLHLLVLVALAALAAIATLLSALIPALFAMKAEPQSVLRGAGRGVSPRAARSRMARFLVATEVAIAAVLLVACSLLFRTLYNLEHKWLGFDVENVTTFYATPPTSAGYFSGALAGAQPHALPPPVATTIYAPILTQLRQLPGVEEAALASALPFSGIDMRSSFELNGHKNITQQEKDFHHAAMRVMSGGYMQAMRSPMLQGRAISDSDTEDQPYIAVVNDAFARQFLRGSDPIGQQIGFGGPETGMQKRYTIVGVTTDAAQRKVSEPAAPELDLSYRQIPRDSFYYTLLVSSATNYVLRTRTNEDLAPAIHRVLQRIAPGFAIDDLQTMQRAVDQSNFNQRLGLYLIAAFAALAIAMVIVGLYGVLSQFVSQRRQEIGVRMALGATSESILALILRQGSTLIAVGLGAGIVAALGASQLIASFLFGVRPMDTLSYAAAALALFTVGLAAALIPARRAAATDPMDALRAE